MALIREERPRPELLVFPFRQSGLEPGFEDDRSLEKTYEVTVTLSYAEAYTQAELADVKHNEDRYKW